MKAVIKNYSFNATSKTVTLTDFTTVLLERLQLIIDVTSNTILYNFADPTIATATVATNVITLSNVGSASAGDKLQIIYDVATGDPTYDVQPVSASSLPLPSGAATAANQTTGNTSLSNIDTAQGAKADAAATDSTSSWSVIAVLKGLYAKLAGTLAVSGTVTSNIGATNGLALDATLTGGNQQVQGNVASGAADSGNPTKVGGKYNATLPTLTDGQRGDAQVNNRSIMLVNPTAAFGSAYNGFNMIGNGGDNSNGSGALWIAGSNWNGSTYDRIRTPATFKTATATASGNTAVWTPTSGKKFRIMRFQVEVTADAKQTTGGDLTIDLQDSTTSIGQTFSVFVPGTAGTTMQGNYQTGWIDLGNGKLSSAANNVLNINLSAALTGGAVRINAIGCEE